MFCSVRESLDKKPNWGDGLGTPVGPPTQQRQAPCPCRIEGSEQGSVSVGTG